MFDLTYEKISSFCEKFGTFSRGEIYYNLGAVGEINFCQNSLSFDATVRGLNDDYFVDVSFDREGSLEYAFCDCPAFHRYPGYCKHIVALLLTIIEEGHRFIDPESKAREITENIFYYFEKERGVNAVKEINLEYTLNFNNREINGLSYNLFSLNLKVGEDKTYVVKNIKHFFKHIKEEKPLKFGQKFTYNPQEHIFKKEDRPAVEVISEVFDMDRLHSAFDPYTDKKVFQGKEVFLPQSYVKKLLEALKGRTFSFNLQGEYNEVQILERDLPLNFYLNREGEGLILELKSKHPLVPLTADGSYFFFAGNIYKPSPRQRRNFLPFYQSLMQNGSKSIIIPSEYKERFVSEITEELIKTGTLKVDEDLEKEIQREPLEAEVYLDSEEEGITAQLKYVYGERIINPLGSENGGAGAEGSILMRDVKKERNIMNYFEKADFKVRGKKMYMEKEQEEKIFAFIYEILPEIQEHCTVFYSEKFKNVKVKQLTSFKGRIGMNKSLDLLEFEFCLEGVNREEIPEVLASLKEKKRYHRLRDGSFLPIDSQELEEMAEITRELDLEKSDFKKEVINLPKYRVLHLDQLSQEGRVKSLEPDRECRKLIQNIKKPADLNLEIPEGLESVLRGYQKTGFKWLKTLSAYGFGGILADDMGLGKTLQAIAFICSEVKERAQVRDRQEPGESSDSFEPYLVIVPTSLVYNWKTEIENFAPQLKVQVISGTKRERTQKIKDPGDFQVLITSYPLVRRDVDLYTDMKFSCCILDEAQNIKNPNSQTARSVKLIPTRSYMALTGTPMENSLTELWSIFDCIMPGYLPPYKNFVKNFSSVEKEGDGEASEKLARKVRPFIMRRLKSEVLAELPAKIEHQVVSELTREQKKVYLAYLEQIRRQVASDIKEQGFEKSRIKILAGLMRLRQICCHPSLYLENYKGESGKLIQLKDILQEVIRGGGRVLLFSQFTQMLSIIENMLKSQGYSYLNLDGSVKSGERLRRVQAFNEGEADIFLISLKAGGTGLNLTGADTVVHYDLWWNPAVEDQASDRAHRIGQKKVVQVMKMISAGTIEEKIYDLQQKKKELIDRVIQPGETFFSSMGEKEIKELLDF